MFLKQLLYFFMNGKNNTLTDLSVFELKEMIENKTPFLLLDVREKEEVEIAKLSPCLWIPMGQIEK